jgi:phage baseplate assembly protein W
MVMDARSRDFLGKGWAFPLQLDPQTGEIGHARFEEDIQDSIRIILGTSKGERVMRPDFGCGIHDLVFEAVSTQLIARVQGEVEDALRTYEARIDVLGVEASTRRLADGVLEVSIDYRVRATNQPGNFVYPFYFKEA